jgi:hypothetical protein
MLRPDPIDRALRCVWPPRSETPALPTTSSQVHLKYEAIITISYKHKLSEHVWSWMKRELGVLRSGLSQGKGAIGVA